MGVTNTNGNGISPPQSQEQLAAYLRERVAAGKATGSPSPSPPPQVVTSELDMPRSADYNPKDTIPNTPLAASVISAALGAMAGAALLAAAAPLWRALGSETWAWARPQLGIYLAAMGIFHLLEFWTTAGWNYRKLSVDAFLLNNTAHYQIAHATGLVEYFVSSYFWPHKFETAFACPPALLAFTAIMIAAQAFRSLAMVHASNSFSHIVKDKKLEDHVLITNGVYGYVRHPSYVGFFYWAVATQLLLSNVVSTIGFIVVLGRFFSSRIRDEERYLVRFFGDAYVQYRQRVGSGLPFLTK